MKEIKIILIVLFNISLWWFFYFIAPEKQDDGYNLMAVLTCFVLLCISVWKIIIIAEPE
jgi:hypothetical protein